MACESLDSSFALFYRLLREGLVLLSRPALLSFWPSVLLTISVIDCCSFLQERWSC